jgi:hypothetical protein
VDELFVFISSFFIHFLSYFNQQAGYGSISISNYNTKNYIIMTDKNFKTELRVANNFLQRYSETGDETYLIVANQIYEKVARKNGH